MVNLIFKISKDTATPAMAVLRESLSMENILPVLGRSLNNTIRENFDWLEATRPNKLGAPRQHYYSHARESTSFTVDADSATVHIRQIGIRLRYYGGMVKAGKNESCRGGGLTKYLTIPVTPEAYGHVACDFPDLQVLWGSNGPYGLGRVTKGASIARGGKSPQTIEVLYILKAEVEIPPDETMLPTTDRMVGQMKTDFYAYVHLLWRRAARGLGGLTP